MDYQSLIEHKLVPQGSSGSETIYPCPFCEDINTGHHMYINYNSNKWHCFKCERGGRTLDSLLKRLGMSVEIDYDRYYNETSDRLDTELKELNKSLNVSLEQYKFDYSYDLDITTIYFQNHIQPLSLQAQQYLLNRGLSYENMNNFRLYEGKDNRGKIIHIKGKDYVGRNYSGRIMIPSMRRDNRVSYYLARDYKNIYKNKYSNAPKEIGIGSEDVWDLDMIQSDCIIICEGVFTALAVDLALGKRIACATYGKSIAHNSSTTLDNVKSQLDKLLMNNYSQYILFYDKDARESTNSTAKSLHDRGANVKIVVIPDNWYGAKADAGDMTKQEIKYLLSNAKDYNKLDFVEGI